MLEIAPYRYSRALLIIPLLVIFSINCQSPCPKYWESFESSCYQFVAAPLTNLSHASSVCQSWGSSLVNVDTKQEHIFIAKYLTKFDPSLKTWYTSGVKNRAQNRWYWQGEEKPFSFDSAWHSDIEKLKRREDADRLRLQKMKHTAGPSISNNLDQMDGRSKRDMLSHNDTYFGDITRSELTFKAYQNDDPRMDSYGFDDPHMIFVSWSDSYGDNVVYFYSVRDGSWRWNASDPLEPRAFICELYETGTQTLTSSNTASSYSFEQNNRDYAYGQFDSIPGSSNSYWNPASLGPGSISRPLDPNFVHRGVRFVSEPRDLTYDAKSLERRAQLTYVADAYPPPQYEWYKDGTKIDVATDKRLSITNGILEISDPDGERDAATYYCSATNKYGTALSSKARLNFKTIKDFKPDALPIKAYVRTSIIIPCQAPESYPDVRFYWFKDSLPNFVPKDNRIFHSWKGNLYIANVDRSDDGYYICFIKSATTNTGTNTLGKTSKGIQLQVSDKFVNSKRKPVMEVGFPATFPSNPLLGQEVRMECVAYGDPLPQYNWTRAEAPLPSKARMEDYNRVLIIPDVQPSDNGNYKCKASNVIGDVEQAVHLTISAAPIFTVPLRDHFVDHGSRVEFVCEAFGNPTVQYKWFKNGLPFNPVSVESYGMGQSGTESRIQFLSDPNDREKLLREGLFFDAQVKIIVINEVSEKDNGIYQCEASNVHGIHYSTAHLKVMAFKPDFVKSTVGAGNTSNYYRRDSLVAAENSNVTLSCRPQAAPKPKFVWSFYRENGHRLTLHIDGRRLVQLNNGDLLIRHLRFSDSGGYTCTVSNYLGNAAISTDLKILGDSRITRHPISITSGPHANLSLECHASTEPELDLAFVWTFNGVPIDLTKPYFRQRYQIIFAHSHRSKLIIVKATTFQTGTYKCHALTTIDKVSSVPAHVTIAGAPCAPSTVSATELTTNMAKLRWTNGGDNGAQVIGYVIQGQTVYRDWFTLTKVLGTGAKMVGQIRNPVYASYEYIVDSLLPYNSYKFRIAAINEFGVGDYSTPSGSYTMRSDKPHVIPRNLRGGGGMVGDLVIRWDALLRDEYGAPGLGYEVSWLKKEDWDRSGKKGKFEKKFLHDPNINFYVTRVNKENFFSDYVVKIRAINNVGLGPESPVRTIKSAEDVPTKEPTLVQAFPHNSTALEVRWKGLDPDKRDIVRGILKGYKIQYGFEKDLTPNDRRTRILYGALDEGLVIGLQANVRYWVKVMAFNSAGNGPLSDPVYMHTFRDAPLMQPTDLAINGPTYEGAVRISWNGVYTSTNEEPLEGYKIRIWEGREDISQYQDTPVGLVNYHDIYNFPQHKVYKIRVLGYSRGGDGKMSQSLEVCIKCDEIERQDHLERLSLEYAERMSKVAYHVYQTSEALLVKSSILIHLSFFAIVMILLNTIFI